jgi:hypothetical protein
MTRNEFWQKIIPELLSDNFAVMLYKEHDIDGWAGWLDAGENDNEFVVALDHPMAFETAIHEYCHYLQWKNKPDLWYSVGDTYNVLIDWLDDKNIIEDESRLDKSLHDIIMLEHDCELMSLNFATSNCIENFDPKRYIQAANLYLWHYHFNRKFRKRPKQPICSTNAVDEMSCTFNSDYSFYLNLNNLKNSRQDRIIQEYS